MKQGDQLLKHLWMRQDGGSHRDGNGGSERNSILIYFQAKADVLSSFLPFLVFKCFYQQRVALFQFFSA